MNDGWETPWDLFKILDDEFHFSLDVCADYKNHKVNPFFGEYHPGEFIDSLAQPWAKATCWMNPPYSRGNIDRFIKKAYNESIKGV